jgi:RNA polymerase sigma-70 factor (ECF subfamily)
MALHHLRDGDSAEEVAQECLHRVVAAVAQGKLRDPARLGGFARAIAHHVIVDVIRSRRRAASSESGITDVAVPAEDQLTLLVAAEDRARVHAALARLSPGDREILRASFFDGLSSQELAARLGEPGPRVRKRKERALARLRDALQAGPGHTPERGPTLSTTDWSTTAPKGMSR